MQLQQFLLYPIILLVFATTATAQTCTEIGQNPSTAFPVCGTKVFSQESVPTCGNRAVPGPTCSNPGDGGHEDVNPYWYKFTCYKAGTLGFKITPKLLSDDYDWQLFDITGHSPNDVYTDASLYVCMNWSGEGGITGASSAGTKRDVCGGYGQPLFSTMPTLVEGHEYLLLISHFSPGQSGYDLNFTGGTADITSPGIPSIVHARYNCGNYTIGVKLSKKVLCKTLATDGSDFTFSSGGANISGITGVGCSSGFDLDSVLIQLDGPLGPGDYTISSRTGTDGNTVLDVCGNSLATGEGADFHIDPPPVVELRNMAVVGCAPDKIKIGLSAPIRCASVAADGSDFTITGSPLASIISATGQCNSNNLADTVVIQFAQPLYLKGDYVITLITGSDGNTVQGECGQEAMVRQTVSFHTSDTVSADFDYALNKNCKISSLSFSHNGAHDVNSWKWTFDGTDRQTTQNYLKVYNDFGEKQVQLLVSNGVCTDSVSKTILLERTLGALFSVDPGPYCPMDITTAKNESFGNIVSYAWDYGNGKISTAPDPVPQQYFPAAKEQNFRIRLIVIDNLNCQDTADHYIKAVSSCYIDVPNAFSPNNDGVNDFLYPLSAYKAIDLHFTVYNRLGQLVFETADWTRRWDGTVKGQPADVGTYVWMLQYTIKDTGQKVFRKGTATLLR